MADKKTKAKKVIVRKKTRKPVKKNRETALLEKKIKGLKEHLSKNKEDLQSKYLLSKFQNMLEMKNA